MDAEKMIPPGVLTVINAKGLEVATRLADLKSGKDVRLESFKGIDGVGAAGLKLDKEEALRLFLEQINQARQKYMDGTLVHCVECGARRAEFELLERPWFTGCRSCREKGG